MKNSIKEQFKLSWDDVESIFNDPLLSSFNPEKSAMLNFINELRQKGYDKVFRAGQMVYALVLSRSFEHGLRPEQAHIMFEFQSNGIDIYRCNFTETGSFETQHSKVKKLVPEIEKMLNMLKEHSID